LRSGLVEECFPGGAEQAVVADLGESSGQDVLEEPSDEGRCFQSAVLGLPRKRVAEAERDLPILKALDPAVDEGDAEDVAGEVLEDLLAAASVLEMHDPVLAPDLWSNAIDEAGVSQGVAELGAEEDREGSSRGEEIRPIGRDPAWSMAVAPSAGGDEDVDVGVVGHRTGPGVEDSEEAGPGAEVVGIGGEFQQRLGCGAHEHTVDQLLVRSGEGSKLGGEREGSEEVRAREQMRSSVLEPASSLIAVALGAVPVAAGVVGVLAHAAVVAGAQVPAEGRGATGLDVAHGLQVRGQHARAVVLAIGRSALAKDVRELQHGGARRSEALHQAVDRIDGGLPDLPREMGVDLGGPGTAVPESRLDQAEVDAIFEEMGGVGVRLMPISA